MLIYTDTDIINAHKNIFSVVSFLKLICLLTFTFMRFFYILFELFKHPSLYFYLCKNSGGNCDSQAMSWEITRWNVEVPGDVSYRWVTFPRNVAKVLQDRHALGERHHRNDMSSDTSTCHRVTYNDTAGKSSFLFSYWYSADADIRYTTNWEYTSVPNLFVWIILHLFCFSHNFWRSPTQKKKYTPEQDFPAMSREPTRWCTETPGDVSLRWVTFP